MIKGALAFFAASAILGAAFAIIGPVALIRLFGLTALTLAAAGCALELYALRVLDPPAYFALRARWRRDPRARWQHAHPGIVHSVVLQRRPDAAM